jgi:hypothetical protein
MFSSRNKNILAVIRSNNRYSLTKYNKTEIQKRDRTRDRARYKTEAKRGIIKIWLTFPVLRSLEILDKDTYPEIWYTPHELRFTTSGTRAKLMDRLKGSEQLPQPLEILFAFENRKFSPAE